MAEVWNDFNIAWQQCKNPGLPLRLMYRRVQPWDDYQEMISTAVPPDGNHRHWVGVLVSRCHKRSGETVSNLEALNFTRYVRGLKGTEFITQEIVQKNLFHFGTRSLEQGAVILLENYWYAVLSGSVDIVRFGRPQPKGEYHQALIKEKVEAPAVSRPRTQTVSGGFIDVLPSGMGTIPELQVAGTLSEKATFKGGDTFGPLGDGWLVAGDEGVELLCIKFDKLRDMKRRCGSVQTQSDEVKIIENSPLFKNCSQHMLLTMLDELCDNREAPWGDDPLQKWDGLVLVKEGQLQLWADPAPAPKTPKSPAIRGPSKCVLSPPSTPASPKKWSPKVPQMLCVLGPGDAIGEETLLEGPRAVPFTRSKVVSVRFEAWVLPKEKKDDAEDIGILRYLRDNQSGQRQELQERAMAASTWARLRPKALALSKKGGRTIDYVHGEIDPVPKALGGICLSWQERVLY
jgi:hypothetical protein